MRSYSIAPLSAFVLRSSDHLSAAVLTDLPTDPASVTVIIVLLGSIFAVVWFGRDQDPPT